MIKPYRAGSIAAGIIAAMVCAASSVQWAGATTPAMSIDVRAGTTGIGLDYDVALSPRFGARIGYSAFNYDHGIDTAEVHYSGTLRLRMLTGLLDWYAFDSGFRISAGAVGGGTRLDVTGRPAAGGSYTLNGHAYSSADVGSLAGRVKFGHAVSPYVGIGWGNPAGAQHHLHFLADIGAIYIGTPRVTLAATCGPAAPAGSALCTQITDAVPAERERLAHDVRIAQWYPVLDVGLAYRF